VGVVQLEFEAPFMIRGMGFPRKRESAFEDCAQNPRWNTLRRALGKFGSKVQIWIAATLTYSRGGIRGLKQLAGVKAV
jgi:hypothetical protein